MNRLNTLPRILTLALALALGGCASLVPPTEPLAPDAATVPTSVSGAAVAGSVINTEQPLAWRSVVTEPRLVQLIELALTNNRDLRLATLNIDAARAQYRITEAQQLPTVTGSAGATKARTTAGTTQQASVSLGVAAWELDLWGRLGNLKDAALASYLATEQTQRSVQATLVSETAQAWLTLGADEQLLQLAQQTLASRQQSLQLTQKRHALGAATGLELSTAQASAEAARGEVAAARTSRNQALNALRLLVGAEPPAALLPAAGQAGDAAALVAVPAGLPSSVLLQRPDLRAAELGLQAAHANVAAARAALFPTLSLTASAGTASSALGQLFSAGTGVWSLAPSLSLPLFDGGTSRAAVDSAQVAQRIQLTTYEQAIQTAFREVADALDARADLGERLSAQQTLVQAYGTTLTLTTRRQQAGAESALAVLDAQRSLYTAQQSLINLQLAEQANRLVLFKVLGGA